MARLFVGRIGVLSLAILVWGCGAETGTTTLKEDANATTAPVGATSTIVVTTTGASPTSSPPTESSEPEIPADFPVPICGISSGPCQGAFVYSAHPSEVQVIYPESEYEALIEYYQTISGANGGTQFELFPEGYEWQIQGFQIQVAPVDPQTQPQLPPGIWLFVRL